MASKIDIVNMALSFIGEQPITSFDENVPAAKTARLFYYTVLQDILRKHPWNFCQRQEALALMPMPQDWKNQYAYCYALPNHCLQLHYLSGPEASCSSLFKLANHEDIKIILSNLSLASAHFTALVEDTTLYDSSFIMAFARALQAAFIKPLLKSSDSLRQAEELYKIQLDEAKHLDMCEGRRFQDDGEFWNAGHNSGFWNGLS